MAKPILVIRFPLNVWQKINNRENLIKKISIGTGYEYHILTVADQLVDSPQFETHNTDNNTPLDLKDLEERLSILIDGANEIFLSKKEEEEYHLEELTKLQVERFKKIDSFSKLPQWKINEDKK